jgi:PAS domain S-box-containing protein
MAENENPYRFVAEYSNDVIYTVNLRGYFTYVNSAAERIMGRPRPEIVGKHYLSFVRPDFYEKIRTFYEKQYLERIPNTYFEHPVIASDGTTRWLGQNVQLLSVEGKVTGFQAIARDITDRKQAEEELEESERKYRLLAEKMTDIVYIQDMNLRTIYVSPSIEKVLGFTPEERMAQDVREQLTPESMSHVFDVMAKELELEQLGQADPDRTLTIKLEYYHKDGSTRWLENIVSGIRDDKGVLTGLHGVSRDITERRKAEEALRESEKRYRELVDFLPISLFEVDLEGNIISANPAISETFGYTQADFEKGLDGFQMIIPDDQERLASNIQRLLRGERRGPSEYTGIRKDGSTFPLMIYPGVIVRNDKPMRIMGAIIDLTDRKRMEESLKKSNLSLAEAQRISHIGNWEWNIGDNTMYWSDEIHRIIKDTPPMCDGDPEVFFDLIFPDDREMVREAVEKAMNEGATSEIEHRIVRRDGMVRDIRQLVEPTFDDTGRITRLIGIVQDVTDKKQAERDLQNARDQLLQSEKLASMGRLSAGVAHEILNPTSIIFMELQMLQMMGTLSPDVLEELKICMDQVKRIVTIAENLKQFSRVPEKKITNASLNELIDHVLALYATQLKIEEIKTEVRYQSDLPLIAMDREKMEQVILNLITNAVAAMEGKDTKVLRIATERETKGRNYDELKITIADTGTGIKSEHISKIFDPFFTTKAQGKGTGLGLSISYGIIHDHGGKIWAENNQWGGVSFFVTLPVKTDAEKNHC